MLIPPSEEPLEIWGVNSGICNLTVPSHTAEEYFLRDFFTRRDDFFVPHVDDRIREEDGKTHYRFTLNELAESFFWRYEPGNLADYFEERISEFDGQSEIFVNQVRSYDLSRSAVIMDFLMNNNQKAFMLESTVKLDIPEKLRSKSETSLQELDQFRGHPVKGHYICKLDLPAIYDCLQKQSVLLVYPSTSTFLHHREDFGPELDSVANHYESLARAKLGYK